MQQSLFVNSNVNVGSNQIQTGSKYGYLQMPRLGGQLGAMAAMGSNSSKLMAVQQNMSAAENTRNHIAPKQSSYAKLAFQKSVAAVGLAGIMFTGTPAKAASININRPTPSVVVAQNAPMNI